MQAEDILAYMEEHGSKPLTAEELARGLAASDGAELLAHLESLEEQGLLVRTRKNRYGLPAKMGLIVGTVQGHSQGYAFILPEQAGLDDIFVGPGHLQGAMHNDRVIVRLLHQPRPGGRAEGEVIRVLNRANRQVVGVLERRGKYGFVSPDEKRLGGDIFVPAEGLNGARHGDKVVVEMTRWPEGRRLPEGRISQVLGRQGDPGVDILAIIYKYQLPLHFPRRVLQAAERIPERLRPVDLVGRRDLRDKLIVTIDGADAKDLDDAVSLEISEDGSYLVGVHIADVGYYVPEGSPLDLEARRRGTSVYLVDRVLPMLPPRLSNGICSLTAGEDRLTLSVAMQLTPDGEMKDYVIFPAVIRVARRLTYEAVNAFLDGEAGAVTEPAGLAGMLQEMDKLAQLLRSHRLAAGALDFDLPEAKVALDAEGKPVEIVNRSRGRAETIIEELMILANRTVARHLSGLEAPCLYRVHEAPSGERLQELRDLLQPWGYRLKGRQKITSRAVQKVLEQARGRPEEKFVHTVVLRSMQHARYAATWQGHFGLASDYYCHFTSPIRRYPDLVVHRSLREVIEGAGVSQEHHQRSLISQWAEQASARERLAEEAERESVELKKIEYMQRYLGAVFPGRVSGVAPYGIFVELENTVEGLVHVSTMTGDYYHYLEDQLALLGENTRQTYRIGTLVQVLVVRADPEARQVDFELVAGD